MMDTIQIRPISEADVAAFRELRLEALRLHPDAFSSDLAVNQRHPESFWSERVRGAIGSDQQFICVAEAGGVLVGMTGIRRGDSPKTEHGAMIWGVYVRASHRGQGLGERLLDTCIGWARRCGIGIIKLAVVATNAPALRCYERRGFTVYGREPRAIRIDGQDHDELLMALEL